MSAKARRKRQTKSRPLVGHDLDVSADFILNSDGSDSDSVLPHDRSFLQFATQMDVGVDGKWVPVQLSLLDGGGSANDAVTVETELETKTPVQTLPPSSRKASKQERQATPIDSPSVSTATRTAKLRDPQSKRRGKGVRGPAGQRGSRQKGRRRHADSDDLDDEPESAAQANETAPPDSPSETRPNRRRKGKKKSARRPMAAFEAADVGSPTTAPVSRCDVSPPLRSASPPITPHASGSFSPSATSLSVGLNVGSLSPSLSPRLSPPSAAANGVSAFSLSSGAAQGMPVSPIAGISAGGAVPVTSQVLDLPPFLHRRDVAVEDAYTATQLDAQGKVTRTYTAASPPRKALQALGRGQSLLACLRDGQHAAGAGPATDVRPIFPLTNEHKSVVSRTSATEHKTQTNSGEQKSLVDRITQVDRHQSAEVPTGRTVPPLEEMLLEELSRCLDTIEHVGMLPGNMSQWLVNHLYERHMLTPESLAKFRGCALNFLHLKGGLVDWMDLAAMFPLRTLVLEKCAGVTDAVFVMMGQLSKRLKSSVDAAAAAETKSPSSSEQDGAAADETQLAPSHGVMALRSLACADGDGESTAPGVESVQGHVFRLRIHVTPLSGSLQHLTINECRGVTHNGLAHIPGLFPQLLTLRLPGADLTNSVLKSFSSLTSLQTLDLSGCGKISAAGLEGLSAMSSLSSLDLSRCMRVQGTALNCLQGRTSLVRLRLRGLNLHDGGVSVLSELTSLRHLDLYSMRNLTDEALSSLRPLGELRSLCVTHTAFSGRLLQLLNECCVNLTSLHIAQAEHMSEDDLLMYLPCMATLQELKMRRLPWLTDNVMLALGPLRQLRRLVVSQSIDIEITHSHVMEMNSAGNLQELQVRGCAFTEAGFAALASCKRLEHLDVSRCVGPYHSDFCVLMELKELVHLDLSFCELDAPALAAVGSLRKLQLLRLKGCECEPLKDGFSHLRALTSLTSLNLSQCLLSDEQAVSFLPYLTNLNWLHLKGCSHLSDKALARCLSPLVRLVHLNMEGCSHLGDECMLVMCTSTGLCDTLTSLDVSQCGLLSNAAACRVGRLHGLSELNVTGCSAVDDGWLDSLSPLSRLKSLRMSGDSISDECGMPRLQSFARRNKAVVQLNYDFLRQPGGTSGSNRKALSSSRRRGSTSSVVVVDGVDVWNQQTLDEDALQSFAYSLGVSLAPTAPTAEEAVETQRNRRARKEPKGKKPKARKQKQKMPSRGMGKNSGGMGSGYGR